MRSVRTVPLTRSLGLKVMLAYLAGLVLSIALLVVFAALTLRGPLLARMDISDLARGMAARVRIDGPAGTARIDAARSSNVLWAFENLRGETAYRLLDARGEPVLWSGAGAAFWPAAGPARLARDRFDFERDGVAMYGATEPLERAGRTWYLQVAVSARMMALLHRVAMPLVGSGIVVFALVLLVAFGLCAYLTLRYTFKPLRDVSESAAAISPRSLHARLETRAVPSEIVPLVESFNRALARLEQGYRAQQEFLGNAAHELKTPLALIRAQIELGGGDERHRQALLSDVEYMTRQVQQLLRLAEASGAHDYQVARVPVRQVVDEAAAYLGRMAEAAEVRVAVAHAPLGDGMWMADRAALFTLLKNLLENAIQHAPPGSRVEVVVRDDTLSVRDSGPGVDAEQLPLLFERFWRAAHRRDHGAGLGLAICREIALAHGWQLTAERAMPGLRMVLRRQGGDGPSV